jgi:hypothetical protein
MAVASTTISQVLSFAQLAWIGQIPSEFLRLDLLALSQELGIEKGESKAAKRRVHHSRRSMADFSVEQF